MAKRGLRAVHNATKGKRRRKVRGGQRFHINSCEQLSKLQRENRESRDYILKSLPAFSVHLRRELKVGKGEHVVLHGGSRKTMLSVQGWIFGTQHLTHLLKNAVIYALSCLFNYKSINTTYLGLRVIQYLNSKLLIFKSQVLINFHDKC